MNDPTKAEQTIFAFTVREQCVMRGYPLDGYTEEEIWAACVEMAKRTRAFMDRYAKVSGVDMDSQTYTLTPPEIAQMLAEGHDAAQGLLVPQRG